MSIQLPIQGLHADIPHGTDVKVLADAQARKLDARLNPHWAIDLSGWPTDGATWPTLDIEGFGGPVVDENGVTTMGGAWGPITLTDDDDNFVERTSAGVVSAQLGGFTPDAIAMYVITTASGEITAIEDHRVPAAVPNLAAALLALRALTPAANEVPMFDGASSATLLDFDTDTALTADSDSAIASQKAVRAFVLAQIALLVGTAPGLLDTLGEISDALADDEDFAATITTLLAGKAALAGATFVGPVEVPNDPYDATGWNGSTEVPTKDAIRDAIESIVAGGIANGSVTPAKLSTAAKTFQIPVPFSNGGAAIPAGFWCDVPVKFGGTITDWDLFGNNDIVVDVYKCTYADYDDGATHPVSGDSIWGGSPPTLSSVKKNQATGLSITVSAGDVLRFHVVSATATRSSLTLSGIKT